MNVFVDLIIIVSIIKVIIIIDLRLNFGKLKLNGCIMFIYFVFVIIEKFIFFINVVIIVFKIILFKIDIVWKNFFRNLLDIKIIIIINVVSKRFGIFLKFLVLELLLVFWILIFIKERLIIVIMVFVIIVGKNFSIFLYKGVINIIIIVVIIMELYVVFIFRFLLIIINGFMVVNV